MIENSKMILNEMWNTLPSLSKSTTDSLSLGQVSITQTQPAKHKYNKDLLEIDFF